MPSSRRAVAPEPRPRKRSEPLLTSNLSSSFSLFPSLILEGGECGVDSRESEVDCSSPHPTPHSPELHLRHRRLRGNRHFEQLAVSGEEGRTLRGVDLAVLRLARVRVFLARRLIRTDARLFILLGSGVKEHELIGNVAAERLAIDE